MFEMSRSKACNRVPTSLDLSLLRRDAPAEYYFYKPSKRLPITRPAISSERARTGRSGVSGSQHPTILHLRVNRCHAAH